VDWPTTSYSAGSLRFMAKAFNSTVGVMFAANVSLVTIT